MWTPFFKLYLSMRKNALLAHFFNLFMSLRGLCRGDRGKVGPFENHVNNI